MTGTSTAAANQNDVASINKAMPVPPTVIKIPAIKGPIITGIFIAGLKQVVTGHDIRDDDKRANCCQGYE